IRPRPARAAHEPTSIDTSRAGRRQTIEGFGTCLSGDVGSEGWFQQLYFDDLRASILRIDITPHFVAPYSDHVYNSPWFGNDPMLPGPEGNNVRTYTGPSDYSRSFAGRSAPIAVMGEDIDRNVEYFDFDGNSGSTRGAMAQLGTM